VLLEVRTLSDALLLADDVVFPIPEVLPDSVLLRNVDFHVVSMLPDAMLPAGVVVLPVLELLSDEVLLIVFFFFFFES
jgi:hypothetical protein